MLISLKQALQWLELPYQFEVDLELLHRRYVELILHAHPDRFLDAPPWLQLEAQRKVERLNTAYQALKSPLQRAEWFLSDAGYWTEDTKMTESLSQAVFEWHERLEAAQTSPSQLALLQTEFQEVGKQTMELMRQALTQKDWAGALEPFQLLRALEKLSFISNEKGGLNLCNPNR